MSDKCILNHSDISTRIAQNKKTILSAGEDVEKMYSHILVMGIQTDRAVLKNSFTVKHTLAISSNNPISRFLPKINENVYLQKDVCECP